MKMFRCRDAIRFCSAVSGLLVLLMLSSITHASDVRYLWQSRDQFVALERQDITASGPAQPNDHPAELTLDRLTAILSSIDMRPADGDKQGPLFTRPAVEALAPYLRQGLQQASPSQDVTFAVIGLHTALYGLAKSPKVTTGRVFYKAGRLNIIVGLVQQEVRDRDDRRLFPFTPGTRQKSSTGEWTLVTNISLVRRDWMAFGDEWRTPAVSTPGTEQRLPPAQTASAPPEKQNSDTRNPAERLSTLKELKDKGLITEEEYRGKRLEIMNTL